MRPDRSDYDHLREHADALAEWVLQLTQRVDSTPAQIAVARYQSFLDAVSRKEH